MKTLSKPKPKPKAEATPEPKPAPVRRSTVARLEAALEKRGAPLAEARAEIAELREREHEAAREALKADPERSAFAVRSPAQEAQRKRAELEKTVGHLETEIELLGAELAEAQAAEAAKTLAEKTRDARKLAEQERELRAEAAEVFAELAARWDQLAAVLSARSALVGEVTQSQVLERVDPETRQRFDEAAAFVVEPVPTTLATFLDEALEATTGPRPGEDAEGLDELNAHRRRHGLQPEQRHVSPAQRELAEAYPDLRDTVGRAEVSGVAIRRRESAAVDWPGGEAA